MRRMTIGSVLALLLTANPAAYSQPAGDAPAGDPPAAAPDGDAVVWARRSLRIADAPAEDILRGMINAAAEEHAGVIGLPPHEAADLLKATPPGSPGLFGGGNNSGGDAGQPDRLGLELDLRTLPRGRAKPKADDFVDSVIVTLEQRLRDLYRDERGVARADRAVTEAADAVAERRARLRAVEQEIRKVTGRADPSVEAIRASLPKLDEERQALKLQLAGKQARQEALAQAIDRLARAAGERAKDDAVATELGRVVEARERAAELTRRQIEAGHAGTGELGAAEAAAAEARARLLERREAVAQANGGELLTTLNRELAMLSIDVAESQAKLAAMDALLERYVAVQDPLTAAEDARRELARAEAILVQAEEQRQQARASVPDPVLRIVRADAMAPDDPRLKDTPGGDSQPDADAEPGDGSPQGR